MILSALIAEVQALTGREDDTVLVTSARVIRWLNDAQQYIVKRCIGHLDLETKDADAISLISGVYSHSFAYLSPTVQHLLDVYYMDGAQSRQLWYRETSKFDEEHPDPSLYEGIPCEWTRRGNAIELYPTPSDSEGAYSEITLAETVTATTWSTDGKTMTGSGSTWKTAGVTLVEVGDVIKIVSGTNATAGYCQVVTVTNDTEIVLDRSIGASPSGVTYKFYKKVKVLRLNYTKRPETFVIGTLTASSDMSDSEQGLIYFAVSEAFKAIGGKQAESDTYMQYYLAWLDDYRQQKDGLYLAESNNLLNS